MFKFKMDKLDLNDNCLENFYKLLKNIVNIESNKELYNYYENIFKTNKEIELLEIEPVFQEKDVVHKGFSFQFDAVNGFVSIMSILVFIAVVCIGIIVINILAG